MMLYIRPAVSCMMYVDDTVFTARIFLNVSAVEMKFIIKHLAQSAVEMKISFLHLPFQLQILQLFRLLFVDIIRREVHIISLNTHARRFCNGKICEVWCQRSSITHTFFFLT